MKIIIFGASGTAGSEVVRQAIADPEIEHLTIVVRKAIDFEHPKVKTIVHNDFLDYSGMLPIFREVDSCIWCLGISQTKVNKEQYFVITHDYMLAAAKAMLSVNPEISFIFLSGQGADSTERSRILFAKVKGKTENALKSLPFKRLYILRPAGIVSVNQADNFASDQQKGFTLVKLVARILPAFAITTVQLAQAMLALIKSNGKSSLLENRDIKEIVRIEK